MLKKVVLGIIAGSFALSAQTVLADDAQFWTGSSYQGVSALPFTGLSPEAVTPRVVAPMAAPQEMRQARGTAVTLPAPYNIEGGYFN